MKFPYTAQLEDHKGQLIKVAEVGYSWDLERLIAYAKPGDRVVFTLPHPRIAEIEAEREAAEVERKRLEAEVQDAIVRQDTQPV